MLGIAKQASLHKSTTKASQQKTFFGKNEGVWTLWNKFF